MILANEHVGGVPRRPPPRGALPRPRAARPAGRSRCCSRKLADLGVPTPPVPERADAAGGGRARGRDLAAASPTYVAAVGPRPRGVPGARAARAQAGALRPARTSATRGSRARRTATSPRRSAATPTSSSTARCCASSASATTRCPSDLRASSPSTPPRASARRRSSSTSPTRSASPGCSSDRLFERGWEEPWTGEIIGADRLRPVRAASARCSRASCRRGGCRASSSS